MSLGIGLNYILTEVIGVIEHVTGGPWLQMQWSSNTRFLTSQVDGS